ncbi:MAG TPA: ABC transporter substrate-binding protein [Candidatus Methylomirabilis sp.]|nr:ABC transporter substrate-binding protein [Candidatus Methylomirabilis sp.]
MTQFRIANCGLRNGASAILVVAISLGLFAASLAAEAQRPGVPRIGVLSQHAMPDPWVEALRQGLREQGWVEGENLRLEYRYADEKLERLPRLATELVGLKVDVIVTGGEAGIRAARDATSTIPIVMANSGDPVGTGLVKSLSRPGGNITGLSLLNLELGGKRMDLLKEAVPKVSRVAVLWNATNPVKALELKSTQEAGKVLGVDVTSVEVREPTDLAAAFAGITRARSTGLIVLAEPLTLAHRREIGEFAIKNRLPMIAELREFAEAGGLMTYGPNILDLWGRSATYVDKILKGAKPGELPVEQPTKLELVVNLKTARALGLKIPQPVLFRADEVIR